MIASSSCRLRIERWVVLASSIVAPAAVARAQADGVPGAESATFASERARNALRNFPSRGARTDASVAARSPEETVASFHVLEGLDAELVLAEPVVRQPVCIDFDERGRLWVVQFLQYPYPAGVRIIDFDDQFHAVYDRVPPPPPAHDRGADRITIHSDADGDGVFETHRVFVEGLNMATAVEQGRGGVWVLQPPYLLFYPDADRDDVPDGDPHVHLAGFGLEDTHSAANSLRWGPDGWLYGGQGSGVSSTIRRPGVDSGAGVYFKGQAIWRYQPARRVFELFSEGGGNTFGLELDAAGRAFSGTNGADARGFHFVQGGYFEKNWGEHGYLTNPHAFGFLRRMPHASSVPRFSHTFVIYEDGALGPGLEGRFVAPVPLRNEVVAGELEDHGSSFRTRDVAKVLESDDRWFRPVDIKVGPDGAIYIADWYDTRLTHMDPRDNWDRERGRIYRLVARGAPRGVEPFDLAAESSVELADRLRDPRKWYRQQALRVLADRGDRSLIPLLRERVSAERGSRAADALWALYLSGGLTHDVSGELIRHPSAVVREWTIRLLGDAATELPDELARDLVDVAASERDARVRSQLAASARRLPVHVGLPIVLALLRRDEDAEDPHIPLLLWWALERACDGASERVLDAFRTEDPWRGTLVRREILPRLARRFASYPTPANQRVLSELVRAAPDPEARALLLDGIREAFRGRGVESLAASLIEALDGVPEGIAADGGAPDPARIELRLQSGERSALVPALQLITDESAAGIGDDAGDLARLRLVETIGALGLDEAAPVLLEVLGRSSRPVLREAALRALGELDAPDLPAAILSRWTALDSRLREQALGVLVSRTAWAQKLLEAVGGAGVISKSDVPDEIAERIRLFRDEQLDALVDRYFGARKLASSGEKAQRIAELAAAIRSGPEGDAARGREIFSARCARCHRLFGEGGDLGPDLTAQERKNLDNLLLQIVDPSVGIREGFTQFVVTTTDGRVLTGLVTAREAERIEIRDPSGQSWTIPAARIADERAAATSLMPEGLLDDLDETAARDLFAFLTRETEPAAAGGR